VSVTIDITPDRGNTTFTLLIPTVNLQDSQPANVSMQGITTEHKISIAGPTIPGQTDTYTVQPLSEKGEFRVD
jgi:hypothetical protein